ncbi:hypothetical protein [Bradyrhizobium sp. CCBAU 53421]|uniref:hypothetical protein n=1 Tax=Bradyrhizobium sp. CCBAU 53421 TaxID=1325120 RepID=UPI00188CCA2C|nr:hypothetical protein XH92_17400 [Bradyrhizobium sp. CCBAU 53421]
MNNEQISGKKQRSAGNPDIELGTAFDVPVTFFYDSDNKASPACFRDVAFRLRDVDAYKCFL